MSGIILKPVDPMDEPFRILVLSDIHFGSWSFYKCDCNPILQTPREWAEKLLQELAVCLQPPFSVARPPYDAIILNGDQTSLCEEDGFAATKILIDGLLQNRYCRARSQIVILPGNHDILRSLGGAPVAPDRRDTRFRKLYSECLNSEHPSTKHLGVLHLFRKHKVALLGLDSCRIEGSDNPGIGYIGLDQLEELMESLEVEEANHGDFRRIAFVHHHIETPGSGTPDWLSVPSEERRTSFMADATRIRHALDVFQIDFLLHGHFHSPEMNTVPNRMRQAGRVISVGSVAGALSRCNQRTRQFLVMELFEDRAVLQEFTKRGASSWNPARSVFDLPPRRPIAVGDDVRGFRAKALSEATREWQVYGNWVRVALFFAGDPAMVASVKHTLQTDKPWIEEPTRYEAAWPKLTAEIEKDRKKALEGYKNALDNPKDKANLESYLIRLLRGLIA